MTQFDVIVVGMGGVGSATLYQLARRGVKALAIDPFPIAHDRGSSHGQTRIIRQAYFEHPDYVPLVLAAYRGWAELEARRRRKLLHQVGLLQVGPPAGEVIAGVLASARRHRLPIEEVAPEAIAARWPGLAAPDRSHLGVFEPAAGYLEVENCVRAYVEEALMLGAAALTGESVLSWHATTDQVRVVTESSRFTASRLIITAGAWAGQLLTDLRIPLTVLRKPLFWYRPQGSQYEAQRGCPCFLYETAAGEFYGVPSLEPWGVKIAEHTGGERVDDPLLVDRDLRATDQQRVDAFVREHLSHLQGQPAHHAVCLYTVSPDRHFVIDRHPEHGNVCYAAGLSGHGFKFAPALGQALADLALDGATELPIGFLGAERFRSVSKFADRAATQ
ncbi:MAG: N-methyl-L-tryptophan oxidase [Pirellulales bacterium]|nr:N-methyl-L-tryptophan oxidase [Pirellulales bacterium]